MRVASSSCLSRAFLFSCCRILSGGADQRPRLQGQHQSVFPCPGRTLTSDWPPGSGSCAPSAAPPPACSAPPPAAAASPARAAVCSPGWAPAGAPPSRARAAGSPDLGPPQLVLTSSHCPAVLVGAECSAPWGRGGGRVRRYSCLGALYLGQIDEFFYFNTFIQRSQKDHFGIFFQTFCHKWLLAKTYPRIKTFV